MCISKVKLSLIFFGWFGGSIFGAAAQMTTDITQVVNEASEQHGVVRRIPEKFHVTHMFYSWPYGYVWERDTIQHTWKRWAKTGAWGFLFQSDDRQCEVLYSNFLEGRKHRARLQNDLLNISQGRDDIRFEDHVLAVGGRKVKRRFNADSMFLVELSIEPMEQDSAIYTHCVRMYFTKGSRYIEFVWFFTDGGYERRAEYMRALDGAVYYKRERWRHNRSRSCGTGNRNSIGVSEVVAYVCGEPIRARCFFVFRPGRNNGTENQFSMSRYFASSNRPASTSAIIVRNRSDNTLTLFEG